LTKHLKQKLGEKNALEIVNLTGGNPYIINLISHYLNDHNRNLTLTEIKSLINDDIRISGYKSPSGIIIPENSLEYRQIVTDIRTVNSSLLKKVQQRPELMFDISPRQFEEFIAELMSKRGYEVDLTKATRDGGKDLIIASNKDLGNLIFYVECKQKAQTKPVGVHLVRQLAGSIFADRVTAGILITSSYFSPAAKDYSEQIKHQLSLVDYVRLKDWLKI
jgi:HJR/Mrr/RecB family endonuclease